jgi:hypothetical protein
MDGNADGGASASQDSGYAEYLTDALTSPRFISENYLQKSGLGKI